MKHDTPNTRRWLNRAIQDSLRPENRAPWASPLTKAAFRANLAKRLSQT